MKHATEIARVVGVEVAEADGYFVFEVEVKTTGNVTQVLRIPHSDANWLRLLLAGKESQIPERESRRSFFASKRRKH